MTLKIPSGEAGPAGFPVTFSELRGREGQVEGERT